MGEKEIPLTPEEIENHKKIVENLYSKKKDETEEYLKSTEEQRKKAFEESKLEISKLITNKAFMIDQKKQQEAKLKGIGKQVDIAKKGEDISKSIEEKAFIIDKRKKQVEELKDIGKHVDIEKTGQAINKQISEKAFFIDQKRRKDAELKELE